MIFSASAIGLKLFGLVSLAFHRRPEATSTEASEDVVVSLLLDEWCRHSATNRNDPNSYATIRRIVALRAVGKTVDEVRSEIFTEAAAEEAD
ncbi:hypothetical protein GR247_15740 [Rhizobium leguminosarum]|nr:hypothetical protein [Rhizobium leguminosarum]TAV10214.1 hypothetical protein ELI37_06695 [Rhizobium leguminosarum]